jgi:hypothetical protein
VRIPDHGGANVWRPPQLQQWKWLQMRPELQLRGLPLPQVRTRLGHGHSWSWAGEDWREADDETLKLSSLLVFIHIKALFVYLFGGVEFSITLMHLGIFFKGI